MYLVSKDLHKFYGSGNNKVEVLKGVNCEVDKGEICTLLGPSGSGKSTFLNIVGGIETADAGTVQIQDLNLSHLKDKEMFDYRKEQLGFIFQQYNLIPDLTIKENIEVCAGLSDKPLNLAELIESLGLTEHQNKFPNQVSGGQQQRCAIGRALIKNPGLLLCDEPTGALDYTTSKEILELIEQVNQKYHTTILIVTHNEAIGQMSDRVLRLRDGVVYDCVCNTTKKSAKELEW